MKAKFVKYHSDFVSPENMLVKGQSHYEFMDRRRTVREFSAEALPETLLENLVMTASTAPSGAHKQPWTFCVVTNAQLKSQIRLAAEKEEYRNYHGRMSPDWLEDLSYLGTDWNKPFLEEAPALIVVFKRSYEWVNGRKRNNYYVTESVGIACGFLLQAIHHCGLVALTHTPSPMNFLTKLLNRPENEKPYLLIPVGYLASGAEVPDLERKLPEQVVSWYS